MKIEGIIIKDLQNDVASQQYVDYFTKEDLEWIARYNHEAWEILLAWQ